MQSDARKPSEKPTCGTCALWYNWGTHADNTRPWRMCNDPKFTGNGQAPRYRQARNTCKRWKPNDTDEAAYISEGLEAERAYAAEESA